MAWWKQIGIALALVALVAAGWTLYLPAAAPLFARLGLPAAQQDGGEAAGGPGGGTAGGAPGAVTVIAAPVEAGTAGSRVSAIGDGRAIRSVAVTPLVAGRLVEIAVASGQAVAAGDVLAVLDEESEAIQVARAELALRDAETTLERVERLRGSGSATDVQLREAQLAVERARLELRDAELALDRRRITAPIAGVIGILPVEIGMQVATTTEIATINDRSRILVDFRVPERLVGALAVGDRVAATALARPDRLLDGEIVALDNRVEQETRTLRVQAAIANDDDALRAGMAFRVALAFEGETFPAIDPLAIQWGADGAYVWAVRDGRAARVPVRIVQRSNERILVAAELEPGEPVVTEGMQRVRDGAAVAVHGDPPAAPTDEGAGLGISQAAPPASDT